MAGCWGGRTEFERPIDVAGSVARLYASSGPRDDYVELIMPAAWRADAAVRSRFADLSICTGERSVDVAVIDGSPAVVAATVLRVGEKPDLALSAEDRLVPLLRQLVWAIPRVDFGDLLPLSTVEAAAAPIDAAVAVEAACEIVAEATRRPEPPPLTVETILARALTHAAKGQEHKALRLVDEALRLSSGHVGASLLRDRLVLLGRRDKKRQREPRSVQAQLEVGISWLHLGCDALAVAAFAESVRLAPTNFLARLLLGLAYHHQGRLTEARAAYTVAGRLRPLDPTISGLLDALARGERPPRTVEDDVRSRGGPVSPWAPVSTQSPPLLPAHHPGRVDDRRRGVALLQA